MNIDDMSVPERIRDKVAHAYFEWIYKQFIPEDVIDRFGIDNVIEAYGATNDVKTLMDTRIIKCTYARLVWDESDTLTKMFGFQVSEMSTEVGTYDLENDWQAILYYYGYVGFAALRGLPAVYSYYDSPSCDARLTRNRQHPEHEPDVDICR